MSEIDIQNFKLPDFDFNAVLFLWRVSSMVEMAYGVCMSWGFTPKSELVWVKETGTGTANRKLMMGMGRIVRGAHETCIIATRGKGIEPAIKNQRTVFFAPRGEHSAKPEAFYEIVERLYPPEFQQVPASTHYNQKFSHVELFARRKRPGWLCLGNEIMICGKLCQFKRFDCKPCIRLCKKQHGHKGDCCCNG
jgi:N6-adenosine-specific RNA methylase IME4